MLGAKLLMQKPINEKMTDVRSQCAKDMLNY